MEKWTVAKLKEELKFHGLSVTGKKDQLLKRLQSYQQMQASYGDATRHEDISQLLTPEDSASQVSHSTSIKSTKSKTS